MMLIRGGMLISWSGRNLTFVNNHISDVPIYGYGFGFDVKHIVYDVKIRNNVVSNVGIIPKWKVMNPGLYSVPLVSIRYPPPGGAVTIESAENLIIEKNIFKTCINGIVISFPDAIDNYGNLTIRENMLRGQREVSWREYNRLKVWKTIGIGISTNAYRPDENNERFKVYNSFAEVIILNNTVENYSYPLVLDVPNNTLKKVYVFNNSFINFEKIILSKNLNISRANRLIPKTVKRVTVQIDKNRYYSNETLIIRIRNVGNIDYPLKKAYMKVYNSSTVIYTKSFGGVNACLSPGQELCVTWDFKDSSGKMVSSGNYTVMIVLDGFVFQKNVSVVNIKPIGYREKNDYKTLVAILILVAIITLIVVDALKSLKHELS